IIKKAAPASWIKFFALYAALVLLISFVTWPYLWTDPLHKFIAAFGFMSDNPTQLQVLFNGQLYRADKLPGRYLPILLSLTLTEPVIPLFIIGAIIIFWKPRSTPHASCIPDRSSLIILILWFFIPFAYVILRKPPMYDGYRHFLFMLPPLFIFAGFAFEKLFESRTADFSRRLPNKTRWIAIVLIIAIFAPSAYNLIKLHPYQYAYYNSFIGGTSGAFRNYETEYWLTCYKEAVENFNTPNAQLFVKREPGIAQYYADSTIAIRDYRAEFGEIQPGDYVLVNTRANEDVKTFKDAPTVVQIRRGDAVFCEIKQIP
ncbi:MAG: hypothetical protein HYZ24_19200, partial [Chloroflexi bacterium]|nr:hypothetical protein [Chloroflexota bacterium]